MSIELVFQFEFCLSARDHGAGVNMVYYAAL